MASTMLESSKPLERLHIRFHPQDEAISQDEETCEIVEDNKVTTIRFHNYAQVFSIPGLYNQLFGGPDSETKCVSPQVIAGLVKEHLSSIKPRDSTNQENPNILRILDFGAGNGMIGEELRHSLHPDKSTWQEIFILGWDILPEAKEATARDRPGIYNDYIAADINTHKLPNSAQTHTFDILTTASALSFGDATVNDFKTATSLVRAGGLLVFNLNEQFLDIASIHNNSSSSSSKNTPTQQAPTLPAPKAKHDGFLGMVSNAVDNKNLTILETKRYRHRLSVAGKELYYVAVVALKHGDLV